MGGGYRVVQLLLVIRVDIFIEECSFVEKHNHLMFFRRSSLNLKGGNFNLDLSRSIHHL